MRHELSRRFRREAARHGRGIGHRVACLGEGRDEIGRLPRESRNGRQHNGRRVNQRYATGFRREALLEARVLEAAHQC